MGYIPNELSADEARNLYEQGEISADEAKHLSNGDYDPNKSEGYFDEDDCWHSPMNEDD